MILTKCILRCDRCAKEEIHDFEVRDGGGGGIRLIYLPAPWEVYAEINHPIRHFCSSKCYDGWR